MKRIIYVCDLCEENYNSYDDFLQLKTIRKTNIFGDYYVDRHKIYICPNCQRKIKKVI